MRAGIFTYPWDLADEGHDLALGRIAGAGLTAVNLACAYHAGRFLLPHNPRSRVRYAEDGALYFRPDRAASGRLRPRVSALVRDDGDPLTDLDRARRGHGLDLVAWVVLLHNSWLGERRPERAQRNAFGDVHRHALCPADRDVRAYAVAVVTDIVRRAEVAAIELESPGYMGFAHGDHHELTGVALDPVQEALLGVSFHPAELDRARAAGVDGKRLRGRVAGLLLGAWEGRAALHDAEGPTSEARALLDDPEFAAYRRVQGEVAASLAAELRDAIRATSPATEVRHFAALGAGGIAELPGAAAALPEVADGALTGYARADEEVGGRVAALRRVMGDKPVHGMVRAIAPDTVAADQVGPRVAAWRAAGVDGIDFYNYGLMTLPMLDAIGAALRDVPAEPAP